MPYKKGTTTKGRGIHSAKQRRYFGALAGRGVGWAKDKLRGTRKGKKR